MDQLNLHTFLMGITGRKAPLKTIVGQVYSTSSAQKSEQEESRLEVGLGYLGQLCQKKKVGKLESDELEVGQTSLPHFSTVQETGSTTHMTQNHHPNHLQVHR